MGLLVLLTSLRSVRSEELFFKCPGNLRDLLNYSDELFLKIINKYYQQKIENELIRVSEPASLFIK